MLVGVPREIKTEEYRVGMTPAGVRELVHRGHQVLVERGAGAALSFYDEHYRTAGASICDDAAEIWLRADMIVKVKEPQPIECDRIREGQILFTYLHLAPNPDLTARLVQSGGIAIAYETVTDPRGRLPLLAPMSEIAGRMSIQAGAHCLEIPQGGNGTLLGGVPGVAPGNVVVLGGGVVGVNAARIALGVGASVVVLDRSIERLTELDAAYGPHLKTVYSMQETVEEHVARADLVIGAVLIPGAAAPRLVTRRMLEQMKDGAVIVDVAIDQGGCFETSRPTTHREPTYKVEGVVHYCVANMPGAVARTSTLALTNATLPFVVRLADQGYPQAIVHDEHLRNGLNVHRGFVTHAAVARDLGYRFVPPLEALKRDRHAGA
ncbi:MAG: alanine dehydrogenase [Gammaproteobacteria bacterium]